MTKRSYFLMFVALLCAISTNAQTVHNQTELNTAISNATAGTTIVLANGTWTNLHININKTGTNSDPITIKAESTGGVLLEGNSRVNLGGEYIFFEGVTFQNPSNLSLDPIIEFKSSDRCNHCKVSNVKIDSYNGTAAQEEDVFKWVLVRGQYNEISYCSFIGKNGVGSIINDNRNSSDPDYTKIHHNYFGNRTPVGGVVNNFNDQDAIRIGWSGTSLSSSYTEVYNNYFDNFHGEVEIISNKSCNNKYYNNTFNNYSGSLTLRHGDDCEVYGNYFFADNNVFTAGVRVMGENHKIYNNYIEGVNSKKTDGSTSNATGGINVSNGVLDSELNEYYQVKNTTIINNTFVNCDYAMRIGTTVKSTCTEPPVDLSVANNIMLNTSVNAFQEKTAAIGTSSYTGNITQEGSWDLTSGVDHNQTVSSGLLEAGTDFYRITEGSPAIDAGQGSYAFLTSDILGGIRTASFDAGAEEFNGGGQTGPYTADDIGVAVGFGASSEPYIVASPTSLRYLLEGGSKTFNIISNTSWTISDDADWLSYDVLSGSINAEITVSASENTTNAIRTATITISGDGINTTIAVSQSDGVFVPEDAVELTVSEVTGVGTQEGGVNIPENTINNILGDRWSGQSSDGSAYLTFDLGCKHTLTTVSIYFHKGGDRTSDVKILSSEDGVDYIDRTGVITSNGQEGYEDFTLDMINARFIRIEGYGNSEGSGWNSYEEVKFYGDPECTEETAIFKRPNVENTLLIYPIPVVGNQVNISIDKKTLGRVRVYDLAGKLVLEQTINSSKGILNVASLHDGTYIVMARGMSKLLVKYK